MTATKRCQLCGRDANDVKPAFIRWRDAEPGRTFDTIDRCEDRIACRERTEALDEPWPVEDGAPRETPA